MKSGAIALILLILFSKAFAMTEEDKKIAADRTCANQLITLVNISYHEAKIKAAVESGRTKTPPQEPKKFIFSKDVDSQYRAISEELMSISKIFKKKMPPDNETVNQGQIILDKAVALSKKSAAKEFATCTDWFKTLTVETIKACGTQVEKLSQAESEACLNKAQSSEQVKSKFKKLTKVTERLKKRVR